MVFGTGEVEIRIKPEKKSYAFGETVRGIVSLKLKKEKKAKMLTVLLMSEYVSEGVFSDTSNQTYVVHRKLDSEKNYVAPGKDYNFELKIPEKKEMLELKSYGSGKKEAQGKIFENEKMLAKANWFLVASFEADKIKTKLEPIKIK
ncbi:MAG: hypothetical protein JW772_01765 [Candidatus Diapherotrites archaeon]|nr:hypothetical protein [Candidatus Diapherotrites archaeon]